MGYLASRKVCRPLQKSRGATTTAADFTAAAVLPVVKAARTPGSDTDARDPLDEEEEPPRPFRIGTNESRVRTTR